MKRFPANIPRKMFWSKDVDGTGNCPTCRGVLANENHVYLMALRRGKAIESFVVGCKGGYFCEGCPSVVLENDVFERIAEQKLKGRDDSEYIVLGLVDMEAIPASQPTIPLGSNENPIPLVGFTNLSVPEKGQNHPIGRKHLKRGTAKQKKRKKK